MSWTTSEKEYKKIFENSCDILVEYFKDVLGISDPTEEELSYLKYLSGQKYLGFEDGGRNLNNHSRRVLATLQRASLDKTWLLKLINELKRSLKAERRIIDIGRKDPLGSKDKLQKEFSLMHDASTKIEGLLLEVDLPFDIGWALTLSTFGGLTELNMRMDTLGIPINLERLGGDISLINNKDREVTQTGVGTTLLDETELGAIRKDAYLNYEMAWTSLPEQNNARYNYIQIPIHTSMQELKSLLTGENLDAFNKANKADLERSPIVIQDFAAKQFVLNSLNAKLPQREICSLLSEKYGISKQYFELDDFVRSLRK
jgi:hypothetical protein